VPLAGADGRFYGVLSTHSPDIRWDWQLENTRPIADEIAAILAAARPDAGRSSRTAKLRPA
jgi:hypothetical protein